MQDGGITVCHDLFKVYQEHNSWCQLEWHFTLVAGMPATCCTLQQRFHCQHTPSANTVFCAAPFISFSFVVEGLRNPQLT
jgi:hypothetical protein